MGWVIIVLVIIVLFCLVLANVRIVPQSKAFVVERLGTYSATWQTGIQDRKSVV